MANSPQARKRARQAEKRRQHNVAKKSAMRTAIKKTLKAITEKDHTKANDAFRQVTVLVDRTANPNQGARLKSRLNKRIKALAAN